MAPFTAEERQRLSETLKKSLGPEYISNRAGPAGRQSYLNGGVAIQLANEIFGFDGWSSEIKNTTVDYIDVDENKRASVGVSVTMRITLKDGTYREDIGYASSQNSPNKGIAIDKARKAATTDAVKRTLKNFGNALGNCLYDKSYLQGVIQMGSPQVKFSPANLYRHDQYRPKDVAPQLALQQAQQQRVPAPTVSLPHPHLQLQQARSSPPPPPQQHHHHHHHHQLQLEAQSHQRAQRTPPAQHIKPAQTHEQAQSTSRKRHQDQVDMHQKRAKQDNHHEYRPVKEEVVASTSEALPLLLPEDSFSYEGDDEFYAMFQNEPNEDEFTIKEDEFVKIDE
ncbi:DNA repair and recombination protein RAD52 [Mucor circinelloides 1006PhL]|uniref:DNA repair and recombination protein RAD52 n=1 Tax=Mucor circinelloides f. circinelloides (strain 1006PhL) TaxID=1220926 RepID=S2IY26_MUCC1|nr:DNA repair and recombination protein RAD52 [Mucor circinelloides 1006PhL]